MQETQETWVWSLGREDPLEKEWQPTLVFLPGKSHRMRSLAGYKPKCGKKVGYDLETKPLLPYIYLHVHIYVSVQFSCSVVSDSLQPHESQHTRPPCPSQSPGVHSNSRPLSWWCYPAISSSVIPFSSCPQSLPASESFPMSQLFAWGGQSTPRADLL